MWVLVLLAIVWAAALGPMVWRKLREREVISSVVSFHRQLSHLSAGSGADTSSVPGAAIGFSAAARRLAGKPSDLGAITMGAGVVRPPDLGPLVSRATTIRRRRVVSVLVLGVVLSLLCGLVSSVFFYLAVVFVAAALAYFALLAYFHQLAVERAQKVVALETRRGVVQALDAARTHSGVQPGTVRSGPGGATWTVTTPVQRSERVASANS
jgi:hypothetical protein